MGADEGDLAEFLEFVESKGWSERIRYEGAVEPARVREKLAQATVFVLPSVDEPFPMTVLEALSVGTPTVVTDSCDIAADLAERGAVSVSAPPAAALADAVLELLNNATKRTAMGRPDARRSRTRTASDLSSTTSSTSTGWRSSAAESSPKQSERKGWRRG